jgi:transcriptional regulator with XRE-family HTH domain
MKQSELAKLVGISQNHLSQLERGTRKVSLQLLEKFSEALEMAPADLLRDYHPTPDDSDLGKVIKWLRETQEISVEDFAAAIDESPDTVKKWERKEGSMNQVATEKLFLIAKALDTTVDYLVGFTEDPSSDEEEDITLPRKKRHPQGSLFPAGNPRTVFVPANGDAATTNVDGTSVTYKEEQGEKNNIIFERGEGVNKIRMVLPPTPETYAFLREQWALTDEQKPARKPQDNGAEKSA